jgi:hypothetical protein
MAANNYVLAYSYKRLTMKHKWRTIAHRIDAFCRFWMVLAYCTVFGFLFGAKMGDPYAPAGHKLLADSVEDEFHEGGPRAYDGTFMFYGIWNLTFTSRGFWVAMIAPICLLLLGVLWFSAKLFASYKTQLFSLSAQRKDGANAAANAFTRIRERAGRATNCGRMKRYSLEGNSPGRISGSNANGGADDRKLRT